MKLVKKHFLFVVLLLSTVKGYTQLSVTARLNHILPNSPDSLGYIIVDAQGGTPPYNYHWLQGVSPHDKDRVLVQRLNYELKVKDASGDSVMRRYAVAYKPLWNRFNFVVSRNDSLLIDGTPSGYATATALNVLRAGEDGFVEYVVPSVGGCLFGFSKAITDSTSLNDIDYGFYITSDFSLYVGPANGLQYIGTIATGDVIRMGRDSGGEFYVSINDLEYVRYNCSLSFCPLEGNLWLKASIDNAVFGNVGLSYASVDYVEAINVIATVNHIKASNLVGNGSISVMAQGGKSPYVYSWSPNTYTGPNATNLEPGTYTCLVEDAVLNTVGQQIYRVGYSVDWADFYKSRQIDDTLVANELDNAAALSSNILKASTPGWVEHVVPVFEHPYMIGFVQTRGSLSDYSDISAGFLMSENYALYSWDGSSFKLVIEQCAPGDVIRLERNETNCTIYRNNEPVQDFGADLSAPLRIKAYLENGYLANLGCSFLKPLELSALSSEIVSPEEPNSGGIKLVAKYGTPPYTYLWDDSSTENERLNLSKGVYTATVTDSGGESATIVVTLGNEVKLVHATNMLNHEDDRYIKVNDARVGYANTNKYIQAGGNGTFNFSMKDVNSCMTFVLQPFAPSSQSTDPIAVTAKHSIVNMALTELPQENSAAFERINFVNNEVINDSMRVYRYEFFEEGCSECTRLNLNGIYQNFGELYVLFNGLTIEKPVSIEGPVKLSIGVNEDVVSVSKNGDVIGSVSYVNDQNLGANIAISTHNVSLFDVFDTGNTDTGGGNLLSDCKPCSKDLDMNFMQTAVYNERGEPISWIRQYFDIMGRPIQSQAKNFSNNSILAQQPIYDAYGRPIAETLPAPIGKSCFCYEPAFVSQPGSSNAYNYNNFDVPDHYSLASGDRSYPQPVNNTNSFGLGWYYSDNNALEQFVPTASTPYARIQYSTVRPGDVMKASKPGYKLNSGSNHETYHFTMSTMGELNHAFGPGQHWRIDEITDYNTTNNCSGIIRPVPLLNTAPISMKSIEVDENGRESVTFTDLTGNMVATCLAGKVDGSNVQTQPVSTFLSFTEEEQRYVDVHLPDGCQNSLSITYPGGTPGTYPVFNIIDLKTGLMVKFSGSTSFTGSNPNLPAGFYRIMVASFAAGQTGAYINQNLNYYNYALYYYDYANRLKASIPPKGFNSTYEFAGNPNPYNGARVVHIIETSANQPANFPNGKSWSLNDAEFDNSFLITPELIEAGQTLSYRMEVKFDNVYDLGTDLVNEDRVAYADYSARTTLLGEDDYGAPDFEHTVYFKATPVYFKVKVALTDPNGNVIENTIQERNDLLCTIYQDTFGNEKKVWTPLSFNYHREFANPGEESAAPQVAKLKILELEPIETTFGDGNDGLEKLAGLLGDLKITAKGTGVKYLARPQHVLTERYRYNSWSQVLSHVNPDEGMTEFVYSADGKLKFTQNAQEAASYSSYHYGRFGYTRFDEAGRPVSSGQYLSNQGMPWPTTFFCFLNYADNAQLNGNLPSPFYSVHNILDGPLATQPHLDQYSRDVTQIGYDSPDPTFAGTTGLPVSGGGITYVQRHLSGRISYTQNFAKKTWYSYDEQGRLEWAAQRYYTVNGNSFMVKTYRYYYGNDGNLIKLEYNPEAADKLTHYYEYDADSRLKRVYTSRNGGVSKALQAEYSYYQHGPLKRVELAGKMQARDYIYTINGWLKGINAGEEDEEYDPGADGILSTGNTRNTCYKDLFGLSLDYFVNDYQREYTKVQSHEDNSTAPDIFNGLIKGQRWHTEVDATKANQSFFQLMYGYTYDHKYQLTDAQFALPVNGNQNRGLSNTVILSSNTGNDYRVNTLSYDLNGNLLAMKRNAYVAGSAGLNMDNLVYTYEGCGNRLNKVVDYVSGNPYNTLGFKGGQSTNNYVYNEIGQLTQDVSNNKKYIYNSQGNIIAIKNNSGYTIAEYEYDEAGYRILKTVYPTPGTSLRHYTWYVRDPSGNIVCTAHKSGTSSGVNYTSMGEWNIYGAERLGVIENTGSTEEYIYELKDHLGNVRSTFKKSPKTSVSATFNMITGPDANWCIDPHARITHYFDGSPGTYHMNGFIRTDNPSGSQYISPAAIKADGTGLYRIPVKNGDALTLNWDFLWESGTLPSGFMIIKLTDASGNLLGNSLSLINLNTSVSTPVSGNWNTATYNMVVNTNQAEAYLGVYPYNNSLPNKTIYFDNINITFNSGSISQPELVSMADYYPHGSVMPGRNYNNTYTSRHGYQGEFAEMDPETNENFFDLRNYDALLGRFKTPDPYGQYWSPYLAMGNNHPNMIDPDGGFGFPTAGSPFLGTARPGVSMHASPSWGGALAGGLALQASSSAERLTQDVATMNIAIDAKVSLSVQNFGVTFNRNSRTGDGLHGTVITFKLTNEGDDSYGFVQTVSTNMTNSQADNVLDPTLTPVEFIDGYQKEGKDGSLSSSGTPGLYTNGHNSSGKGNLDIWDQPGRKFSSKGDVYFKAQTSLVKKVNGKYVRVKTISWGFTLTKSGKIINHRTRISSPSGFHKTVINTL